MSDADRRCHPDMVYASTLALLVALAIDAMATVAALRDRALLKTLAEDLGTELHGMTVFAHSIPPSAIVAAAILTGIALAGKELVFRRRLVSCLINIVAIALISTAYWGYHHAMLSPIMFTIHSLS